MKFKPLLAVSMLALMMSSASFAADDMKQDYNAKPEGSSYTAPEADDSKATRELKEGLNKAGQEMRETADDIRAFFLDGKDGQVQPVTFHADMTAEGMIGKKITTPSGDTIAKVNDILIDKNGVATKVIVSDGGLLGIGDKLAAFDYSRVITKRDDGRIEMSLSQDMIDKAKDFSYDAKDAGKATVIPPDSTSVKDLLDGEVYDNADKKVASVDNLSIVDGKADRVIIGYGKVLGMGGDLAAVDYSGLTLLKQAGETDVKMSLSASRQFADFRKTASK